MKIYQKKFGEHYETLYVKKNGNITCECLHNLYDPRRDVNSTCKHASLLREAINSGNLKGWSDVTPK